MVIQLASRFLPHLMRYLYYILLYMIGVRYIITCSLVPRLYLCHTQANQKVHGLSTLHFLLPLKCAGRAWEQAM